MDGRCIRCPADARMWFWRVTDRAELVFCKHHGEQHQPALEAQQWRLARDTRPELVPALP